MEECPVAAAGSAAVEEAEAASEKGRDQAKSAL